MIRPMKQYRLRIAVYAAAGLVASIAVAACTHDFDAYQATGDGVSTPDGSLEGSTNGNDGSSSMNDSGIGADTATVDANGADAACATAPMCAATSTTCKAPCEATLTTCNAQCNGGGSGSCKFKCKSDHDKCVQTCTNTCRTCAGMGCTAACN
jgi:hypothetical protein